MSVTDDLLQHAREYAAKFASAGLPPAPATGVVVVACMDARLDPARVLGLDEGDAHVLRNAGGVVTDDVLRSLTISERLLGTREIILLHHTDCGMTTFTDDELAARVESECGHRPAFAFEAFADLDEDLRRCMERIRACPFLPHTDRVRGFVYDVDTGGVREVT